jgi:hypothetical protein
MTLKASRAVVAMENRAWAWMVHIRDDHYKGYGMTPTQELSGLFLAACAVACASPSVTWPSPGWSSRRLNRACGKYPGAGRIGT